MSKPFLHFVITRFNLKRKEDPPKGWLERRCDLFERYCLPSVRAQRNKNFYWLVLFGDDMESSPEWFRLQIKKWCVECEELYPTFCGGWGHQTISGCVEDIIRCKMLSENADYILSSRIDNDDGMHEDYIKDLQQAALANIRKGVGAVVLDYAHGVRYHEPSNTFYHWHRPSGPFISLLRKFNDDGEKGLKTVHSMGAHTDAAKVAPIKNVGGKKPHWVQVIHDTNLSNRLKGTEKTLTTDELDGFGWLRVGGKA